MNSGDVVSAEEKRPASKRQKFNEGATAPLEPPVNPPFQSKSPPPVDQVSTALVRIAKHVSNPNKFIKAASLLLELLSQPSSISPDNIDLLFNALIASMQNTKLPEQPDLSRTYAKLFHTVLHIDPSPFSPAQQRQLDVYKLLTVTRYELSTDDSFDFNKTMGRIKTLVDQLPHDGDTNTRTSDDKDTKMASPKEQQPNGGGGGGEKIPLPPHWSEQHALLMKRSAILDCIDYARGVPYKSKPWTRTSIDLLIEHVEKNKAEKFPLDDEKKRIDAMMKFMREERAQRRQQQGPSAKDNRRDVTAFEQQAREWAGKSSGSNRKAVGSGDDQKIHTWLG